MVAGVETGRQSTIEEFEHNLLWILTRCTNDHTDIVLLEEALCTPANSSGNHNRSSLLVEPSGKGAWFVGRGSEDLGPTDTLAIVLDIEEVKLFAVTKMG